MRVFVFEHLSGGIRSDQAATQPPCLLRQGGAMLRAVADDFLAMGAEVATMLHARSRVDGSGLNVVTVDERTDIERTFDELARDADAVLVIAPESDNLLIDWLRRLEDIGATSLGCSPAAAQLCGDKLVMAKHLADASVPTPATTTLREFPGPSEREYPVVVKPRYGAGCEYTLMCRRLEDLPSLDQPEELIVQPFAPGLAASCSLIVNDALIAPLPPGEQFIDGDDTLSYHGGHIPLDVELAGRAQSLASAAAACVPGLGGFVGVDLILGDSPDDDRVIELNPRLTLSYVALSGMCATNLADLMLDPDALVSWSDRTVRFDADGTLTGN